MKLLNLRGNTNLELAITIKQMCSLFQTLSRRTLSCTQNAQSNEREVNEVHANKDAEEEEEWYDATEGDFIEVEKTDEETHTSIKKSPLLEHATLSRPMISSARRRSPSSQRQLMNSGDEKSQTGAVERKDAVQEQVPASPQGSIRSDVAIAETLWVREMSQSSHASTSTDDLRSPPQTPPRSTEHRDAASQTPLQRRSTLNRATCPFRQLPMMFQSHFRCSFRHKRFRSKTTGGACSLSDNYVAGKRECR